MEGWISLHRKISDHWIFKDPLKLKAWITILLNVNHGPSKILLGDRLLLCDRGESLRSLDSWVKLFGAGWNKSKVRRFFILLENDSMIVTKSETITTRLTVCNYDSYQGERNADETQTKRKRNADETQVTPNNNDNNENNDEEKKVFNFRKSLISLGIEETIVSDWLKVRAKKKASNTETSFNKIKNQIELTGMKANDCIRIAVEKDWKGFEASWLNDQAPTKKTINSVWDQPKYKTS